MKTLFLVPVLAASLLTGCGTIGIVSSSLSQASALSDADINTLSQQACAAVDESSRLVPANSAYNTRVTQIVAGLKGANVPNFDIKVYESAQVNAWSTSNGCVRIHTGLLDMMSDDEVKALLSHELGHLKLGHRKDDFYFAYAETVAVIAEAGDGEVRPLAPSQFGDLGQELIEIKFSEMKEEEADDYALDLLGKNNASTAALGTAFDKLAKLGNGKSAMMVSHQDTSARKKSRAQRTASK